MTPDYAAARALADAAEALLADTTPGPWDASTSYPIGYDTLIDGDGYLEIADVDFTCGAHELLPALATTLRALADVAEAQAALLAELAAPLAGLAYTPEEAYTCGHCGAQAWHEIGFAHADGCLVLRARALVAPEGT